MKENINLTDLSGATMSSEQFISELDVLLNRDDCYTFLEYISKNKAIFISAVSIISAVVIFAASHNCFYDYLSAVQCER